MLLQKQLKTNNPAFLHSGKKTAYKFIYFLNRYIGKKSIFQVIGYFSMLYSLEWLKWASRRTNESKYTQVCTGIYIYPLVHVLIGCFAPQGHCVWQEIMPLLPKFCVEVNCSLIYACSESNSFSQLLWAFLLFLFCTDITIIIRWKYYIVTAPLYPAK